MTRVDIKIKYDITELLIIFRADSDKEYKPGKSRLITPCQAGFNSSIPKCP